MPSPTVATMTWFLTDLPPGAAALVLLVGAVVIGVVGSRTVRLADALADATGLGEAIFGAVLLGASTSLPGIVTSVSAAASGHAELAYSNALGGIAAQTFFLAIADIAYRPANLEHAAASVSNMVQGALLIVLLAIVLLLMSAPSVVIGWIHPGSVLLLVAYCYGVRIARRSGTSATWRAIRTDKTVEDIPEARNTIPPDRLGRAWAVFAAHALVLAVAGYVVARAGIGLARGTELSESVVGAFFTAIATSLPELVTSVAAVRQGALTLAVANIVGGNTFDVLFIAFADVAYRDGSIYAAVGQRQVFIVALSIALTGLLLLGLLRREKHGVANIGFESLLILILYTVGVVVVTLG